MGQLILLSDQFADRARPGAQAHPVFFFDLACPFSYLAAERVERLLGEVSWVPVAGPLGIEPSKRGLWSCSCPWFGRRAFRRRPAPPFAPQFGRRNFAVGRGSHWPLRGLHSAAALTSRIPRSLPKPRPRPRADYRSRNAWPPRKTR